jgi:hypothetical protein
VGREAVNTKPVTNIVTQGNGAHSCEVVVPKLIIVLGNINEVITALIMNAFVD